MDILAEPRTRRAWCALTSTDQNAPPQPAGAVLGELGRPNIQVDPEKVGGVVLLLDGGQAAVVVAERRLDTWGPPIKNDV